MTKRKCSAGRTTSEPLGSAVFVKSRFARYSESFFLAIDRTRKGRLKRNTRGCLRARYRSKQSRREHKGSRAARAPFDRRLTYAGASVCRGNGKCQLNVPVRAMERLWSCKV